MDADAEHDVWSRARAGSGGVAVAKTTSTTSRPQKPRARPGWEDAFFDALEKTCNVKASAVAAGVARGTVYARRDSDEVFAERMDEALDTSTDRLVGVAYKRAVKGTLKPVFQGGQHVGDVREYSDTLLMFLLRAHRPEVYGEKLNVKVDDWREELRKHGIDPDKALAAARQAIRQD